MRVEGFFSGFFGRIKFILLQTSKYYQIWTNGHICELDRQDELEFCIHNNPKIEASSKQFIFVQNMYASLNKTASKLDETSEI